MPYIKQVDREKFKEFLSNVPLCKTAGELNYMITSICNNYVKNHSKCYQTLNELIGVLECLKLEYYRIIVAPYEDTKIIENGDVYEFN
jgi:hypothetical protein